MLIICYESSNFKEHFIFITIHASHKLVQLWQVLCNVKTDNSTFRAGGFVCIRIIGWKVGMNHVHHMKRTPDKTCYKCISMRVRESYRHYLTPEVIKSLLKVISPIISQVIIRSYTLHQRDNWGYVIKLRSWYQNHRI